MMREEVTVHSISGHQNGFLGVQGFHEMRMASWLLSGVSMLHEKTDLNQEKLFFLGI
jgi:hypothetical protein